MSVNFVLCSNRVNVQLDWCDITHRRSDKNGPSGYLVTDVDFAVEMMSRRQWKRHRMHRHVELNGNKVRAI